MSASEKLLKIVLVGCGGMGRNQVRILKSLVPFELTAVCDLREQIVQEVAAEFGVKAYTDYDVMLEQERPDTVSICTSNASHAILTILAARAGVRGIYCEKPMATNLADAREMVQACREAGAVLVINHQRRIGHDLLTARRLIEEGFLGEVRTLRGQCAGDILSDGTHVVDSLMWLTGDPDVEWVVGQVHRKIDATMIERAKQQSQRCGCDVAPGMRYGHAVENGGLGLIQLRDGPRLEITCGDLRAQFRTYQDYEIVGDRATLWRTGDQVKPNLYINDGGTGGWHTGIDDKWVLRPISSDDGAGAWRPVEIPDDLPEPGIPGGYLRFAEAIREGTPHPMDGDRALKGFELVMAIYEGARTHGKLEMPLHQKRFPLEPMIEQGAFL